MNRNVLIAGGTGLIGTELAYWLKSIGYNINILSRKPERIRNYKSFFWNPTKTHIDSSAFKNQDFLINLTGESIASKLWTKKRKRDILESRINSIKTLAKGIEESGNINIKVITASAIGFYGNRPNEVLNESSCAGSGFLSKVCQEWEKQADNLFQNPIKIRIGIVLSNKGGYYTQLQKTLRTRLNIIFGNGKQIVSWIHIDDLVQSINKIMLSEDLNRIYNLSSPNPVSIEEMQNSIAKLLKIKALKIKVPLSWVRFLLGDFSELILHSQNVKPESLLKDGYSFHYDNLRTALEDLDRK